jgi:hypothetical protein
MFYVLITVGDIVVTKWTTKWTWLRDQPARISHVADMCTDPFSTSHLNQTPKQIQSLVRPSHSSIVVTSQNPRLPVMSAYDNYSDYTPMEVSTPPGSLQNTPVSTPSRAALLYKPKTLQGSPIKFPTLSTPEKVALKTVEFDADFDDMEPKKNKFKIGRSALGSLAFSRCFHHLFVYQTLPGEFSL